MNTLHAIESVECYDAMICLIILSQKLMALHNVPLEMCHKTPEERFLITIMIDNCLCISNETKYAVGKETNRYIKSTQSLVSISSVNYWQLTVNGDQWNSWIAIK